MATNTIASIDRLKAERDELRPLSPDVVSRVSQRLRLEANYHSNAIEGNSLTLGETRSLILHGLTAHGKPMRDHLDIEGHDDAVKAIEEAVRNRDALNGTFIRNLHRTLLKEPYEADAVDTDGRQVKRTIAVGDYKKTPNNVRTTTGEIYHFTPPEQVRPEMTDLFDWYRDAEGRQEHPIIVAATFHYRFVRIHPFDDGNGRMARLLMNMILMRHGYAVALLRQEDRGQYIQELENADRSEDLGSFIDYVAGCCEYALELHLKAARGEALDDAQTIDREIELFKKSLRGRDGSDELVAMRDHVEAVVYPLVEYCRDKVNLFKSDVFASVWDDWTLSGKDADGSAFKFYHEKLKDLGSVPEEAYHGKSELRFSLSGFDRHDDYFDILVSHTVDHTGSSWQFKATRRLDALHEAECHGDDIAQLQECFNDLLRSIMKELGALATERQNGTGGDESANDPDGHALPSQARDKSG